MTTRRRVCMGGLDKHALLAALEDAGVQLNEAARTLFGHEQFTTSGSPSVIDTVEITVAGLGLREGGTLSELMLKAAQGGLLPCPIELGPYLRLQYPDQAEGHVGRPVTRHRAPPGSLTVISPPLSESDEVPKGFYLRRIEGVPWLRGYRAPAGHVWAPEDQLLLALPGPAR